MVNRASIYIAMLGLAAVANTSAASCDRACLQSHVDSYLAALTKREPSQLELARELRFTENGTVGAIGSGLWREASALGEYRYTVVDADTGHAMFIGVVNEGTRPTIAAIRLQIAEDRISEIEHVVARKGSHALFAPQAFVTPHPSLTSPVKQRLARAKLVAIADSYFEGIEKHDSKIILASESCQRLENGVQTTSQPGRTSKNCAQSADVLTYIKAVNDRRYPIVDVEHGVVVSTILFDIPGDQGAVDTAGVAAGPPAATRAREPRTLLLTEWFKIDDGKIQHIEAIMHNLPHGAKSGWER